MPKEFKPFVIFLGVLTALFVMAMGLIWQTTPQGSKSVQTAQAQTEVASNVVQLTNPSQFSAVVLQTDGVVVVEFYAPWCPTCRKQEPVIAEVASDQVGKAKVVTVNIDDNRSLLEPYGIKGIPTMIIFKNGKEVERFIGYQSREDLDAHIAEAM